MCYKVCSRVTGLLLQGLQASQQCQGVLQTDKSAVIAVYVAMLPEQTHLFGVAARLTCTQHILQSVQTHSVLQHTCVGYQRGSRSCVVSVFQPPSSQVPGVGFWYSRTPRRPLLYPGDSLHQHRKEEKLQQLRQCAVLQIMLRL
jgi:hypothetical protein